MAVDTSPRSTTWTHVDGEWLPGNPPLIGPTSHAMWLGSTVFDGARWFDGIAPDLDLHCQRINRSALAMGLKPVKSAEEIVALAWEGVAKFDGATAIYIKPMYWGEHGAPGSVVSVDAESTRFALCLFEAPMGGHGGTSLTVSPYRRPSPETAMTEAKTGSLYPNSGRMIAEARSRGFDNALVRDLNGNVVETASSNVLHGPRRRGDDAGRQPHLPRRHHPRPRHRPAAQGRFRRRGSGTLRRGFHASRRDLYHRQLFQSRRRHSPRRPRSPGRPGHPQGAGTLHGLGLRPQ
ncbi:hypothetical protein ACVINI_003011 [Rhizobium beringeri]